MAFTNCQEEYAQVCKDIEYWEEKLPKFCAALEELKHQQDKFDMYEDYALEVQDIEQSLVWRRELKLELEQKLALG